MAEILPPNEWKRPEVEYETQQAYELINNIAKMSFDTLKELVFRMKIIEYELFYSPRQDAVEKYHSGEMSYDEFLGQLQKCYTRFDEATDKEIDVAQSEWVDNSSPSWVIYNPNRECVIERSPSAEEEKDIMDVVRDFCR